MLQLDTAVEILTPTENVNGATDMSWAMSLIMPIGITLAVFITIWLLRNITLGKPPKKRVFKTSRNMREDDDTAEDTENIDSKLI